MSRHNAMSARSAPTASIAIRPPVHRDGAVGSAGDAGSGGRPDSVPASVALSCVIAPVLLGRLPSLVRYGTKRPPLPCRLHPPVVPNRYPWFPASFASGREPPTTSLGDDRRGLG